MMFKYAKEGKIRKSAYVIGNSAFAAIGPLFLFSYVVLEAVFHLLSFLLLFCFFLFFSKPHVSHKRR